MLPTALLQTPHPPDTYNISHRQAGVEDGEGGVHSSDREQERREVLSLYTSRCVLSLQLSPRPPSRARWGWVTRRDFSWGHPDTQWQLPEAAAAWKNSKYRKVYAVGEQKPSLYQFLQLNLQWNRGGRSWLGFRSDGFSGVSGLWGWHPWEPQAEGNGEARGGKSVPSEMPGRWD